MPPLQEQIDKYWERFQQIGMGRDPGTMQLVHDRRMVPITRFFNAEGKVTKEYVETPPPGYRWVCQMVQGTQRPIAPEVLMMLEGQMPSTLAEMEEYCKKMLQKVADFRSGLGVKFQSSTPVT